MLRSMVVLFTLVSALGLVAQSPRLPRSADVTEVGSQGTRTFYVQFEGNRQGRLKGESPRSRSAAWSEGTALSYGVKSPRDLTTGVASGHRQHEPVVITKPVGAASPQLFQALCTNEVFRTVMISFPRANARGEEEIYYTIKLTNAVISNYRLFTRNGGDFEEISLVFQKIEVQEVPSKAMAADDWHS